MTPRDTLIDLEKKFWQSMVDQDADTAIGLLAEPALMVSGHGAMKFDHDAYREMADKGSMVLTSFELDDMDVVFPNEQTAVVTYRVRQGMAPRAAAANAKGDGHDNVQEMNDTSTWVRDGDRWLCVMHTETPVQ